MVHGDYRIGNDLFEGDAITGILDWEMVYVGDPHEDLAWALLPNWRHKGREHLLSGLLTESEAIEAWEATAGRPVDLAALRWSTGLDRLGERRVQLRSALIPLQAWLEESGGTAGVRR